MATAAAGRIPTRLAADQPVRNWRARIAPRLAGAALTGLIAGVAAQPLAGNGDIGSNGVGGNLSGNTFAQVVLDARDAARQKDQPRLLAARNAAQAQQHPLLPWLDYWELGSRLSEVGGDEVEAFYTRWRGSYVEDRLRNDWLLELGRRRELPALARDYPRFRMNDDREVSCWALLAEHLSQAASASADPSAAEVSARPRAEPRPSAQLVAAARQAWLAQRDADAGCATLAAVMVDAGGFTPDDIWRKARLSVEAQRPSVARLSVALLDAGAAATVAAPYRAMVGTWQQVAARPVAARPLPTPDAGAALQRPPAAGDQAWPVWPATVGPLARAAAEAIDKPARFLARSAGITHAAHELRLLAVMRLAATDLEAARQLLQADRLALPPQAHSWAWAYAARQAAFKLEPDAVDLVRQAWVRQPARAQLDLSDDTLAWGARAVLRAAPSAERWALLLRQIDAMSDAARGDPTWRYWRAQALLGTAAAMGEKGQPRRAQALDLLQQLSGPLGFYENLAADALGLELAPPALPDPLTPAERQAAQQHPGLQRALQLMALGLRSEGTREWNFSLRGLDDRALLAAARMACDASDWQLCINTAERSRSVVDLGLRYPTPYRAEIEAAARASGLEPALVFGLIRQESRFMPMLRSGVGATGLMQLMPATARWTARQLRLSDFQDSRVAEPQLNIQLGTAYLKRVLDDLDGSPAMAAAAYNAGPGRPRRWREGGVREAAAWTESIPFSETRDYVKKVLVNATLYACILDSWRAPPLLRARLGDHIGPRAAALPTVDADLP